MAMGGPFGGNGQWVRARNEQGAKSFQQELAADAQARAAGIQRSLAFRRRLRRRIGRLLHLG